MVITALTRNQMVGLFRHEGSNPSLSAKTKCLFCSYDKIVYGIRPGLSGSCLKRSKCPWSTKFERRKCLKTINFNL